MELSTLPEHVVVETTEHKCLQSQFSVLYNEAMQLKTQLEEARNQLQVIIFKNNFSVFVNFIFNFIFKDYSFFHQLNQNTISECFQNAHSIFNFSAFVNFFFDFSFRLFFFVNDPFFHQLNQNATSECLQNAHCILNSKCFQSQIFHEKLDKVLSIIF